MSIGKRHVTDTFLCPGGSSTAVQVVSELGTGTGIKMEK
jgi:hypothetical protein